PGPVGGDGRLGDQRARAREALLIVVARRARADVVADAVVELTGPELPGAAADGAERGVTLEAGVAVDRLVLAGDVRARRRHQLLDQVDGRERVARRVEQHDQAGGLVGLVRRAGHRGPAVDDLGEPVVIG